MELHAYKGRKLTEAEILLVKAFEKNELERRKAEEDKKTERLLMAQHSLPSAYSMVGYIVR